MKPFQFQRKDLGRDCASKGLDGCQFRAQFEEGGRGPDNFNQHLEGFLQPARSRGDLEFFVRRRTPQAISAFLLKRM